MENRHAFSLISLLALCALAVACAPGQELYAPEVARIDPVTLQQRIEAPGFHLIDARYGRGWSAIDRKVAGAVREDPHEISSWAGDYPKADTLVIYCA